MGYPGGADIRNGKKAQPKLRMKPNNESQKQNRRKFVQPKKWKLKKWHLKKKLETNYLIVNLSRERITDSTKQILAPGLSFCPTPRHEHASIILRDLLFDRRCRIKLMHLATENEDNCEFPVPSGYTPLPGTSEGLDSFLSNTIRDIMDLHPKKCHSNLTKEEWGILRDLKSNPNLIIKPADKGGALIIMDRDKYEAECLRQLKERLHYRQLPFDKTAEVADNVTKYLRTCKTKKHIAPCIVDFLTPKAPRTALFYILPKIHKKDNPGRLWNFKSSWVMTLPCCQFMTWFSLVTWSVMADVCISCLNVLLTNLIKLVADVFSASFLCCSKHTPKAFPVSPMYLALQILQGIQ